MAVEIPHEMEKEPGKRYYVLPVMFNDRYKRSTVPRTKICLVKFRYHLPGNIVIAMDTQDLFFKCGKAQGGEFILPPPPAEMKYIEMRDPKKSTHPIVGKPVRDIRSIERLPVEGDQCRMI
jgi:hypothetical protein